MASETDRAPSARVDAKVAAIIDSRTDKDLQRGGAANDDDSDNDALFDELENDETFDALRERRMQQLHEEFARERRMKDLNQGVYTEYKDEKQLMDLTTQRKYVIIHFFLPDFNRCDIMHGHLEVLARKHFDTLVAKINVKNCPFLVEKLGVQVLPCLLSFIDGKSVGRIVGFEDLGNSDSFQTSILERQLINQGVFQRAKTTEATNTKSTSIKNSEKKHDSDEDWDD